jgi:putative nucleotidyltransferase with HDIG domain
MASPGSSSDKWFSRLFSRESAPPVATVKRASPARLVLADSAVARQAASLAAPNSVNEQAEMAAWAALALKQMVQEKKPVKPAIAAPTVSVRDRTLAACELDQIPALQSLAQGFERTMNQAHVTVEEVVASLSKDSSLCVRVLRMANSSLVSSQQRIDSLENAVQMLGLERVRNAADAVLILRSAAPSEDGMDMRQLWIHALATASLAQQLEKLLRTTNSAPLYVAGLLHDVGKIVLSMVAPDEYRSLLVAAWKENQPLDVLEKVQIGVDHSEAGVVFARQNKLASITTEAIAHHAHPEHATFHRFEVALVSVANHLSKAHGLGFSGSRLPVRGEYERLTAWQVLESELGYPLDIAALQDELKGHVTRLRSELNTLREDF